MCVVLCCHLSAFVKPFTNNNLHFCWGDLFLFFVLSVCFFWQGGGWVLVYQIEIFLWRIGTGYEFYNRE